MTAPTDKGAATPDALVHALQIARQHVLSKNRAEHMLDGFGPRSVQPSDADLAIIDRVLAEAASPVAETVQPAIATSGLSAGGEAAASAPPQPCAPVVTDANGKEWCLVPAIGTTWDMRNEARELLIDRGFVTERMDALVDALYRAMVNARPIYTPPSPTAGHAVEAGEPSTDTEWAREVLNRLQHSSSSALIDGDKKANTQYARDYIKKALIDAAQILDDVIVNAERLGREVEPVAWRWKFPSGLFSSWNEMGYDHDGADPPMGWQVQFAYTAPPPPSVKPEWQPVTIEDVEGMFRRLHWARIPSLVNELWRDLQSINARIATSTAAAGQEKAHE